MKELSKREIQSGSTEQVVATQELENGSRLPEAPERCVIVVQKEMGVGYLANACSILAITVGCRYPEIVGDSWSDRDGGVHPGISRLGVPILAASAEKIRGLRHGALSCGCDVIGLPAFAHKTSDYEEFSAHMRNCQSAEIEYLGIALLGKKKIVRSLTTHLPLLS